MQKYVAPVSTRSFTDKRPTLIMSFRLVRNSEHETSRARPRQGGRATTPSGHIDVGVGRSCRLLSDDLSGRKWSRCAMQPGSLRHVAGHSAHTRTAPRRTVARTADGPVDAVSRADPHRDGRPDLVLGGPVMALASSAAGQIVAKGGTLIGSRGCRI